MEVQTQNTRDIWSLSECNGSRTHNHLVRQRTLNNLAKLKKWLNWIVCTYLYGSFDCVFFSFQVRISEWIAIHFCLNIKELHSQKSHDIWCLCECNGMRTHNHLVCQWILNHFAKMTKWLNWTVSTYLYGSLNCMFFSSQVRASEWIHTLYLPECQVTP